MYMNMTLVFTNIMLEKFSVIGPGKSCDQRLLADFMKDSSAVRSNCTTLRNLNNKNGHYFCLIKLK